MIYFLSDAHLGSKAFVDGEAHQQRVVSHGKRRMENGEWRKENGEWRMENGKWRIPKSKRQFAPFLQCLKALTTKGIEVHFFTGNHDMWTFGWLERTTGVIVHRGVFVTEIHGKKVLMAHGDGLVPKRWTMNNAQCTMSREQRKKIRAFIRLQKVFHNPIAQTFFRCVPPCIGDAMGYAWAKHSRLKDLQHPCGYKGENEEELVLWAKEMENGERRMENGERRMENGERRNENGFDYYIFGHRHIDLDLMISRSARVIILGDLFRTFTYAQMDEKGDIQLCIQEQNN